MNRRSFGAMMAGAFGALLAPFKAGGYSDSYAISRVAGFPDPPWPWLDDRPYMKLYGRNIPDLGPRHVEFNGVVPYAQWLLENNSNEDMHVDGVDIFYKEWTVRRPLSMHFGCDNGLDISRMPLWMSPNSRRKLYVRADGEYFQLAITDEMDEKSIQHCWFVKDGIWPTCYVRNKG